MAALSTEALDVLHSGRLSPEGLEHLAGTELVRRQILGLARNAS